MKAFQKAKFFNMNFKSIIHSNLLSKNLLLSKSFSSKDTGDSIVIVNGKRTPVGSFMGKLSGVHASLLGAAAIEGALQAAKVEKGQIDEVIMGNVISAGLGQAPARQASIRAGLPTSTICTTINKVCSSGMKAVHFASQSLLTNNSKIIVAGGFESMSLVPHYLYIRKAFPWGEPHMVDGIMFDGLTDSFSKQLMGNCAEKTNKEFKISRADQDNFTISSYERALEATKAGLLKKEIVEVVVEGKKKGEKETVSEDEEPKRFLKDKIPNLKPVFDKDGTITAANASKNCDGGAALVLMKERHARDLGLNPIARILGFADSEIEPVDFSIAPCHAIQKLTKRLNISLDQVDAFEINEAFASTVLANMKLMNLKHEKVNIHGGAVAFGHPIGMSGARIILALINVLQARNGKIGIASICNGGGGASTICVENLRI
jgi:acetyl-CoA C-acetyltransferase